MRARFPEEIYNGKITAHDRKWFFFDVKTSKDGSRRLVITESHGPKSGQERVRMTIWEGDVAHFLQGLLSAMEAMGYSGARQPRPSNCSEA